MTAFDIAVKSADLALKLLQCLAIVIGGWWFLLRKESGQRVGFDVECNFVPLDEKDGHFATEVAFKFTNAGKVEILIYNLMFSVHALEEGSNFQIKEENASLRFPRRLIPPFTRVERLEYGFYVRPGVIQYITHNILLKNPGRVVRVIASFSRVPGEHPPDDEVQLIKRIFKVPSGNRGTPSEPR
jgi:hypothetical protein